jgi:hypothetical protein
LALIKLKLDETQLLRPDVKAFRNFASLAALPNPLIFTLFPKIPGETLVTACDVAWILGKNFKLTTN